MIKVYLTQLCLEIWSVMSTIGGANYAQDIIMMSINATSY